MVQELLIGLNELEKAFQSAIHVTNEIFHELKEGNMKKVQEKNREQMEKITEVKDANNRLVEMMEKIAQMNSIKEARIQMLFPLLKASEKEIVVAKQKEIMGLEERLKEALLRNQQFLEVLISTKNAKIDSIVELYRRREQEKNMFLNEKL